MVRDQISELINKIYNACRVDRDIVVFPYSKLAQSIITALETEGYVKSSSKKGKRGNRVLEIKINRDEQGSLAVNGVKRLSRLSKRVYRKSRSLTLSRGGYEHFILSTPKGIMSDRNAKKEHLGGEILFKIW